MSAGLPGVGLGGLFFILCALFVAPAVELVRTAQGRSSREAWSGVARQFAMALGMVAVIDLTIRAMALLLVGPSADGASGLTGPAIGPIALSAAILGSLLLAVKLLAMALQLRDARPQRVARRVYRAGRRLVLERGGS